MNFTFRDLVGNGSATSSYTLSGERAAGFVVDNNGLFPLVSVRIGAVSDVVKACNVLWEHGILIAPALFPAVPINRGALYDHRGQYRRAGLCGNRSAAEGPQ